MNVWEMELTPLGWVSLLDLGVPIRSMKSPLYGSTPPHVQVVVDRKLSGALRADDHNFIGFSL